MWRSLVPITQIAGKSGVDRATAANAIKAELPTLLGGLPNNMTEPADVAA
ncbi:DUF937 domain-containing protein [Nocardia sp. NPDC052112]